MAVKSMNFSWSSLSNYFAPRWEYLTNHPAFEKSPLKTVFRAILWLGHCLFKIPAIIKFERWNCKFYLEPKLYRVGSTSIFITREDYEPEILYLEKLLSPGMVFVDGGASFGIYSVVAAKLVGDSGLVLAFEAAAETFQGLKKNIELNNFLSVKLFNCALSDQEGKARFYHVDNAPSSYSLGGAKSGADFEEVNLTTLTQVVEHEKINRIDMIKLDVEGAEELVLQGAKALFEKMRPIVLFEINELATKRLFLEKYGAWNFLAEFGYECFCVSKDGDLVKLNNPQLGNNIAIFPHT